MCDPPAFSPAKESAGLEIQMVQLLGEPSLISWVELTELGIRTMSRYPGRASPVAQMGKNLPAMQETQVQSLGGDDPLEKAMTTHSNILAWRIPWID